MFQAEAAKELSVGQIYAASFVYCRGVRLITVVAGERTIRSINPECIPESRCF